MAGCHVRRSRHLFGLGAPDQAVVLCINIDREIGRPESAETSGQSDKEVQVASDAVIPPRIQSGSGDPCVGRPSGLGVRADERLRRGKRPNGPLRLTNVFFGCRLKGRNRSHFPPLSANAKLCGYCFAKYHHFIDQDVCREERGLPQGLSITYDDDVIRRPTGGIRGFLRRLSMSVLSNHTMFAPMIAPVHSRS